MAVLDRQSKIIAVNSVVILKASSSQLRSVDRHGSHIDRNWCEALVCDATGVVEVDQPSRRKHESVEYFVIVRVVCD